MRFVPSGNLDAAGGIGGLLAVSDPDADADPNDPNDVDRRYVYAYDANGNIGQLVDLTPTAWDPNDLDAVMVARYEYEPFGRLSLDIGDADAVGPYGGENPFRFSTKQFDDETGLGYWGERYYWPDLGRWTTRDPIEESGGANLYGYVGNQPIGQFDPRGLIPNAPLGAVAALSHDRTQACCRYVETMTHGGVGGAAAHSHSCWKTHRCPPGLRSPRCCCECGFRSVGIGFHHAKRVVKAEWGSCCLCTVKIKRLSWTDYLLPHFGLELRCPGSKYGAAFTIGLERMAAENGCLGPAEVHIQRRGLAELTVTHAEKKISCEAGQRLKARIMHAYPLSSVSGGAEDREWDIFPIKQCWTFASGWYDSVQGSTECP